VTGLCNAHLALPVGAVVGGLLETIDTDELFAHLAVMGEQLRRMSLARALVSRQHLLGYGGQLVPGELGPLAVDRATHPAEKFVTFRAKKPGHGAWAAVGTPRVRRRRSSRAPYHGDKGVLDGPVDFDQVVDVESDLQPRNARRGDLYGLPTLRTGKVVSGPKSISCRLEALEAVYVEAGKGPGLAVDLEADRTYDLVLDLLLDRG
jgi:hypothetical protein